MLPAAIRRQSPALKVAIDLNAVPPLGITGIEVMDKAKDLDGVILLRARSAWAAMKMRENPQSGDQSRPLRIQRSSPRRRTNLRHWSPASKLTPDDLPIA